jgi:hypothetical protein
VSSNRIYKTLIPFLLAASLFAQLGARALEQSASFLWHVVILQLAPTQTAALSRQRGGAAERRRGLVRLKNVRILNTEDVIFGGGVKENNILEELVAPIFLKVLQSIWG